MTHPVTSPARLGVDPSRLASVLLSSKAPEEILHELFELWGREGLLVEVWLFLRRLPGWAPLARWPRRATAADTTRSAGGSPSTPATSPPAPSEPGDEDSGVSLFIAGAHSRTLRRLLSQPSCGADDRPGPVPSRHGRLFCYSLGSEEEEIGRLILDPVRVRTPPRLSPETFTALTLYLRSVQDRERGDAVALRGDLSRRLILSRDAGQASTMDWKELSQEFPEIIGRSESLRGVLDLVRRAAPREASILIRGESGTGKELIARSIHRLSPRSTGPFVSENCAAFSESLLEAEIFGNEKGAYTGAEKTRAGLLEQAHGGTLFLDEIGEMGPRLQSKLLRVLQERVVRRVGGTETIPVDFRLISATHRDLEEEVKVGRFRRDLLFRIEVVKIAVPSLRQRREDVPLLTHYYLTRLAHEMGVAVPPVDDAALQMLADYDWPGNIRELRNELERAITLTPDVITVDSLSSRLDHPEIHPEVSRRVREELGADIYGLERAVLGGVIRDVLQETGGNKARAARILGIPKTNLYRRIKRYGIA